MLIIGNGRLVTRDEAQPFFENGAVAVDGERNSGGGSEGIPGGGICGRQRWTDHARLYQRP